MIIMNKLVNNNNNNNIRNLGFDTRAENFG